MLGKDNTFFFSVPESSGPEQFNTERATGQKNQTAVDYTDSLARQTQPSASVRHKSYGGYNHFSSPHYAPNVSYKTHAHTYTWLYPGAIFCIQVHGV